MAPDGQIEHETIKPRTGFIGQLYDSLNQSIGEWENPLFKGAPPEAVFCNSWGGREKLFFDVVGSDGKRKQWLTQADLDLLRKTQAATETIPNEDELLYDMFSLMLGGRQPTLEETGHENLAELLLGVSAESQAMSIVNRIFQFVDQNPDTTLSPWLHKQLKLSFSQYSPVMFSTPQRQDLVMLMGTTCFPRKTGYVWNPIRNMRGETGSPFRVDGEFVFDLPYDIQLYYGQRTTRLNALVFFLARHGLSESETAATNLGQVYISRQEYYQTFFPQDPTERRAIHQEEEDNFIITRQCTGYEQLIQQRIQAGLNTLFSLAQSGELDITISDIDQVLSKQSPSQ